MATKTIEIDGLVTFWRLTNATDYDVLRAELEAIGLGEFIPEKATDYQALKNALVKVYGSQRVLIRHLSKKKKSFSVVHEKVLIDPTSGEEYPDYKTSFIAYIADDEILFRYESGLPCYPPRMDSCEEQWQSEMGKVPSEKLAKRLTDIVEYVQGIPLKSGKGGGGLYWLPESNVPIWDAVKRAIAKGHPGNIIDGFDVAKNKKSLSAVSRALVELVESRMTTVRTNLLKKDTGDRAKSTQRGKAEELRELVEDYEDILGTTFDGLKSATEDLGDVETFAAFREMSEKFGE